MSLQSPSSATDYMLTSVDDQKAVHEFVGRQFCFDAINAFFKQHDRGYFTIKGAPGIGKSAFLLECANSYPIAAFYSFHERENTSVECCLRELCLQLIQYGRQTSSNFPEIAIPQGVTQGSWLLSTLLKIVTENLRSTDPLVIVIDGIDYTHLQSQSTGSNLLYLPRYLPPQVYFLLSRRPFPLEQSRLLTEVPTTVLDLDSYQSDRRRDSQQFIKHCRTEYNIDDWLTSRLPQPNREVEFWETLIDISENNFVYLKYSMLQIIEGNVHIQPSYIPPGLKFYYQKHWDKMRSSSSSELAFVILQTLLKDDYFIAAEEIASILNEDEYEVVTVLNRWFEFLQVKQFDGAMYLKLYHASFRYFLIQQLS